MKVRPESLLCGMFTQMLISNEENSISKQNPKGSLHHAKVINYDMHLKEFIPN